MLNDNIRPNVNRSKKIPYCVFILEEARLGGPQIYTLNLLEVLKNNIDVKFIFPKKNSERLVQLCLEKNIPYFTLDFETLSLKPIPLFRYILNFIFDLFVTIKFIVSQKPDIVYVAGGSWQFRTVLASIFTKSRLIWHLNDTNMHSIILLIFSVLSRYADGIVFASEKTEFYYKKLIKGVDNQVVIPSPVSKNNFKGLNKVAKKQGEGLKIITVANVSPVKGLELLIDVAKLCKNNLSFQFFVVGAVFKTQASYFRKILSQISDNEISNITFLGGCDEVDKLLDEMDIYLCCSKAESSPIAVWEAMAKGLPVISTDVGDVKKFIEPFNAGYICSDAAEFYDRLNGFFYKKQIIKVMGDAAKKCAVQNFSQKRCSDLHYQFLCRVSED
jgi:glycosyltransferase involved in cell wall biosynthesis